LGDRLDPTQVMIVDGDIRQEASVGNDFWGIGQIVARGGTLDLRAPTTLNTRARTDQPSRLKSPVGPIDDNHSSNNFFRI
jgi:hypothetical protein